MRVQRRSTNYGAKPLAQMLALTGMQTGDRCFVTDVGVAGSQWVYTGSRWATASQAILLASGGSDSKTTPIAQITGTTSAAFAIPGGAPKIPANLLQAGSTIRIISLVSHVGGNGTFNIAFRLGTAGDVTDQSVHTITGIAASNGYRLDMEYVCTSGSQITNNNNTTPVGVAFDGSILFPGIGAHSSDRYLTIQIGTANAADTFNLMNYSLWVTP